jgi:hypothetical protein
LQHGKFQHGNYNQYYGYRNPGQQEDPRIPFLQESAIFLLLFLEFEYLIQEQGVKTLLK